MTGPVRATLNLRGGEVASLTVLVELRVKVLTGGGHAGATDVHKKRSLLKASVSKTTVFEAVPVLRSSTRTGHPLPGQAGTSGADDVYVWSFHGTVGFMRHYRSTLRKRALMATMTVLRLISAAPTAGPNTIPHPYSAPAATGMAKML